MLRPVVFDDLENLRQVRNKWYKLDIFRQSKEITKQEQLDWYKNNQNAGHIINERAYGKIYSTGEVSFYGFGDWLPQDLQLLLESTTHNSLHGECYQFNPFLTFWLEAQFKVVGYKKKARYHNGRVWDSLLLRWDR
jgi:hypothetical protein